MGENRVRSSSEAARHTAPMMNRRSFTKTRTKTSVHVLFLAPPVFPRSPRLAHTKLTQRKTTLMAAYKLRAKILRKNKDLNQTLKDLELVVFGYPFNKAVF